MEEDEQQLLQMLRDQHWDLPRDGREVLRWETTPAKLEDELATASISMFFEEPRVGYGRRELSPCDVEALREIAWAWACVHDCEDFVSIAAHMVKHFFKEGYKSSAMTPKVCNYTCSEEGLHLAV